MDSKGAVSMKGPLIAGLIALVAVVLALFLLVPSLLPSGLNTLDGSDDGPDAASRLANLSPSAGEVVYGSNVSFEWAAVDGADSYVILITVPGSSIAALNLTSSTNRYDLDSKLSGGSYLWTVQAIEDGVYGPFSNVTTFTIKTSLDSPMLKSPSDGSVHVNSVPTLRWSSVGDATGYRLQIASDTEFADLVVDQRLAGTSYSPTFVMGDGAVYSWRVSAYHDDAWSAWSTTRQFSHDDFLAAPLPLSPVSGSVTGSGQVNLTWSPVEQADGYRVQMSTSESFATLDLSVEVTDEWYVVPGALIGGATYYWRVQAESASTASSWSAAQNFLVPEDSIPFSYTWTYDGRSWTLSGSVPGSDYYYLSGLARNYDYASYVMSADPTVVSVATELKSMAQSAGYGSDLAQFVLAFVQGVPYVLDDESNIASKRQVEYPRYPVETLVDHGGDCEDKAALYASLMQSSAINVDAVMLMYQSTTGGSGHMAVGIAGSFYGTYYSYSGQNYFYCETTGVGWKVGEFPSELQTGYMTSILPC
jgi:hypothetical protein